MEKTLEVVDFCVFDLETTGFEPNRGAEPIEVGAVRIVSGQLEETFQSFVSPKGTIPEKVQSITGIDPEDVAGAPPAETVLRDFQNFVDDSVLVAHNMDFDRSFLEAFAPDPVKNDTVDTLRMSRKLIGDTSHSLDHLVSRFGIDRADSHRALADAKATAELFLKLTHRISTYDDYRQCGIPESVMKEDLNLVLPAVGVGTSIQKNLTQSFSTLSELLEASTGELQSVCGISQERSQKIFEALEEINERSGIDLEPPPTLMNCYKIRYWNWLNGLLNAVGGVLFGSGFFVVEEQLAITLFLLSVPFFLISPAVTYFRRAKYSLTKRILSSFAIMGGWLGFVWYIGYYSTVRRVIQETLKELV